MSALTVPVGHCSVGRAAYRSPALVDGTGDAYFFRENRRSVRC